MNQVFCRLDDGKATLRILKTLFGDGTSASRGQLEKTLDHYGVGRSAFYSSLKVLKELGLIVEVRKRVGDKNLVLTELTEEGVKLDEATELFYSVIEQTFPEKNKRYVLKKDRG